MALQQYHIGGTYYGYDSLTGQLVAFADENQLKQYFPNGIQANAPTLPSNVDTTKAKASPGQMTNPFTSATTPPPTTPSSSTTKQPTQPAQVSNIPSWISSNPQYLAYYNSLTPIQQSLLVNGTTIGQQQSAQGSLNVSVNQDLINKALTAAQTDPTIVATYGDAAKEAASDLQNNLAYYSAEYAQSMGLTQAEQLQARKQLADQYAAAGQAYSGFRKQAQSLQSQEQSAVIQSSQRQMQQQVRALGSAYESQFGSAALANLGGISGGGFSYTPYGGITGSQPLSEQQAVLNKQQQIVSSQANPTTQ